LWFFSFETFVIKKPQNAKKEKVVQPKQKPKQHFSILMLLMMMGMMMVVFSVSKQPKGY